MDPHFCRTNLSSLKQTRCQSMQQFHQNERLFPSQAYDGQDGCQADRHLKQLVQWHIFRRRWNRP